tara:strand:- start:16876 stop:17142 length:267 start_codon:yes stop_codon:yes gene_type:complete
MKPIILEFVIERKGETKTVYEYDFHESLNVITLNDEKKPFIDSRLEDITLLTKTKIKSESDDNDIDILELKTKTFTQRERDDESFSNN